MFTPDADVWERLTFLANSFFAESSCLHGDDLTFTKLSVIVV